MRASTCFTTFVVCSLLAGAGIPAWAGEEPSHGLWLFLDDSGTLLAHQRRDLKMQVSALWERYGVRLFWQDHLPQDHEWADTVLVVRVSDESIARQGARAAHPTTLGAVMFIPEQDRFLHTVFVSPQALRRVLARGGRLTEPALRERIIGQALGRVIAHEIGHILLDMPEHTPTGLMKPRFDAADLMEPSIEHLQIGPEELALLNDLPTRAADERD